MKVIATAIPDVLVIEPNVFGDARGFFLESWNQRAFDALIGRPVRFVQDNHSASARNVLRGLHYQVEQAQGKLVRVVDGEVYDVVVDLRRSSPTFGRAVGERLSAENKRLMWVPEGFAHGFVVLSERAEFLYKTTDYYAPEHERTLLWNDPALGITWPIRGEPVLKPKDAAGTPLAQAETFPVIRVLVTGARGQVGTELERELAGRAEVLAHDRSTLDLADPSQIAARVREAKPDVIVNAGAYTAVDRAESEPDAAQAVNAVAPGVLAEEAKRANALLIHFSTDYVFDGTKRSPYVERDPTHPLGVYGRTKLAGELAIAQSGGRHIILRTSWVYGPHGKNFLLTMLRLAETREELRVVDDQRGAPTSSRSLARLVREMLDRNGDTDELVRSEVDELASHGGLYHATAAGETSWFGFAQAIFDEAKRRRRTLRVPRLLAIPTSEYPTPAKRPAYSVMSSARLREALGVGIPDWRSGLEESVSALPGA